MLRREEYFGRTGTASPCLALLDFTPVGCVGGRTHQARVRLQGTEHVETLVGHRDTVDHHGKKLELHTGDMLVDDARY
jgi:hypothetical protein